MQLLGSQVHSWQPAHTDSIDVPTGAGNFLKPRKDIVNIVSGVEVDGEVEYGFG